ncbi:MAG: hypothetical protein U0893_07745 [Chloroflexota bacterium]
MKALVLAALASLLGGVLILGASHTQAYAQAAPSPTTVTFGASAPTSVKGQLALSAKLAGADGKPVSGQAIDFYVPVELFGRRDAFVGVATTDSTGLATVSYQPSQAGRQTIVARFAGSDTYAASEARAEIQVGEVVPPIVAEPLPFATVREWIPLGMLALVILVWAVLLGVFASTVRAIRHTV